MFKVKAKHWLNIDGTWHGTGETFEVGSIAGIREHVEVIAETPDEVVPEPEKEQEPVTEPEVAEEPETEEVAEPESEPEKEQEPVAEKPKSATGRRGRKAQ